MIFKQMFNCHEINWMISAGMDSDLPLLQRMLIRFHLMMCRQCAQVRAQILSLRDYCRFLDSGEETVGNLLKLAPETRDRIMANLKLAQHQAADPDPKTSA